MEQDVNKIIDNVSAEWSQSLMLANRKIAVLVEELRIQSEENERLKSEIEALKSSEE